MICPHCHSENRATAKYCDECGFPLTGRIAASEAAANESAERLTDAADTDDALSTRSDADGAAEPASTEDAPSQKPSHHNVVLPSIDVRGLNVDEDGKPFAFEDDADFETDADMPAATDEDVEPRSADGLDVEAEDDFSFDPLPGFDEAAEEEPDYDAELPEEADEGASPQSVSAAETNVLTPVATSANDLWRGGSTMQMPRVNDDQQGFGGYRAPEEDARKKPRTKKRFVVLGVVAALAVAAAAVYGTWALELWGGKAVPDVEGMTQADAAAALQSDGFTVRSLQVRSDETEGLVLLTDPAAGSRIEEGSEVVLHVAVARTIPDVLSASQEDALKSLSEAGYSRINIETQKSNEAEGIVLNVEPAVGEKAASTTQITLTVSTPFIVPDVAGTSSEEAQAALEAEGYVVAVSHVYTEDGNEGMVVSTDPVAGSRLNSGETVTMYVAVSRATEVVTATYGILWAGAEVNVAGVNYRIASVDAVSYQGNDTVAYTFTGTPFTYLLGIRVELDPTTVSGTITFNDDNTVQSSSPLISL